MKYFCSVATNIPALRVFPMYKWTAFGSDIPQMSPLGLLWDDFFVCRNNLSSF